MVPLVLTPVIPLCRLLYAHTIGFVRVYHNPSSALNLSFHGPFDVSLREGISGYLGFFFAAFVSVDKESMALLIPMRICLKCTQVPKLDIGRGLVVNQHGANLRANCQFGSGDPNHEAMNWPSRLVHSVDLTQF